MSQDVSPTMNKIEMDAVPDEEGAVGTAVMNPEFSPETFSVDNYADRLMDEVFTGVDHLLETGQDLVEEIPEVSPASVQTVQMPDVAPLSVIPTSPLTESDKDSEAEEAIQPVEKKRPDWSLRIIAALALASCAGAAAVVATQWQSYRLLYLQLTNQAATESIAPATVAAVQSPNQQFATYVQRSLEVLKDQTAINQANGRVSNLSPSAVLQVPPAAIPTVASAPAAIAPITPIAPTAAPGRSGTIIERIYIPVYQTPNGYVPVDPNTQISPEVAAAGIPLAGQQPQQQPGNSQAIASATQSSQASQQADNPSDSFVAQPLPAVEHTLVGLLELGNSSAALFEIDGVTRRFSLGERVGGWTLAEVKNGEALLRRDGAVRSVFVGQTF